MPINRRRTKTEHRREKNKTLTEKASSNEDLENIVLDLQTHQVELESQNEELRLLRLEEEKLAKKFEDLYDFAPVGYLSLGKEGQILSSNLAFSSLVGIERRYLREKSLYSFVVAEDRDILFLHLRRLFKKRKKEKCELRLKGMKNEIFHVRLESSFDLDTEDKMSTMTSVTDISDLVMVQQELKKSEETFRTLADHAPDIIVRFDRECRHLYVNTQTEEVLGIPRENILGKTNRELGFPETLVDFWHRNIQKVFLKRENVMMEFVAPTSIGEKYFEASLVPEFNDRGEVSTVLLISRDVTHFKNSELEIRDLNAKLVKKSLDLEQANKELESFTYSVSHDLRAPLRTIKGFAEALLEDLSAAWPDEARNYLRRITRASGRMEQLIDSLMVLSRVSRKEVEPDLVDLSHMAREFSAELLESHPERKAEFMIQDGIKVLGDRHLISIVIQNLFRNAWKFTRDRSPARIEFGTRNDKKEKVLFIKDNGAGFDMAYSDKLFVPFQRLHSMSDFPGAGVGLATVKRIILKHNGKIWAEAVEGKGATFYFTTKVQRK
jgi:PAS domain S-box-containing protein